MTLKIPIENILFLDIETVPQEQEWSSVSKQMQELYANKTQYQRKDQYTAEDFYTKAGIWAEFGKIICISVAYIVKKETTCFLRTTSFAGHKEWQILTDFKNLLNSHFNKTNQLLCAHNGKEFDFPYIARRMIVNQIEVPNKLALFGKKPWEIPHLDTLELWKFGDYKHYTSLKLLTAILGIPSPKEDIDGSQVATVYYKDKNLDRIIAYCEQDTIAVAQLLLRFLNKPLIDKDNIIRV